MRIQRVASGLLQYLNLRSQGETPDELARVVRPNLDMSLFYDMDNHESQSVGVSMSTGNIDFIEVPGDEIWKLLAVSMVRDSGGTTGAFEWKFTFSIERMIGAGLDGVPFHTSEALAYPSAIGATGRFAYSFLLPRPFLVRPRQRITTQLQYGINTSTGIAENWDGDFWLHFIRMKT